MITLYGDEQIVLEKRRYWLPIAAEGVFLFLIALIPFAALILTSALPENLNNIIKLYQSFYLFLSFIWVMKVWIIFFIVWTNYYLDVLLITNKRVVDIEQIGLFSRDLAELRMENIQDIRVEVVGILASLLDFGNLHIQTAGQIKEFIIKNIHNPNGVKDLISRQQEKLSSR